MQAKLRKLNQLQFHSVLDLLIPQIDQQSAGFRRMFGFEQTIDQWAHWLTLEN